MNALELSTDTIRKEFPILSQTVNGNPLVYLDNAATTQKPIPVLSAINKYYEKQNSNVHRGAHYLSTQATVAFEETRILVKELIGAKHTHEIIFTSGTTGSINLVASVFGKQFIREGDEIIISELEHHSNIVPWQLMCEAYKATLKVIPVNDEGELIYEAYLELLSSNTKLVAVNHISNALGTINPVKQIIKDAHAHGAKVLIDGAQAVAHATVDVQNLDCDFYVFSGHKMFGPTGIGVLYGKEELLNELPPYQGGGEMIKEVTFEKTTYNELPHKFEAGTPHIAGVIGLGAAIRFINDITPEVIGRMEKELLTYAQTEIKKIEKIRLIGTAEEKSSIVSFIVEGIHASDIGVILDQQGIAIRTGHHCTQPLMKRFGVPSTARASFSFYNTLGEIDLLISGIKQAIQMLS